MTRYLIIMMTLLCTLVGCSKDPLEDIAPPRLEGQSAVTFGVVSTDIEEQTRSLVLLGIYESKLHNYNIFCYHKESGEEQHYYSSSVSASTLMLENGDWEVYVFANTDKDMSDMSREEVENYTYTIAKTTDLTTGYRLVMVHHSTISVSGDTSINLEVERLVARFDIDIDFSGDAIGYKIVRTEVINEAATCKIFGNNPPANRVTPTFTCGIYGSMIFYVLENLQGVVSGITSPQDKNIHNAPPSATYIKIYVESATHEIVYTYYLGGNTINDFDIERNTRYEIQININGMNPTDMRVESTKIPIDPVYEIRVTPKEKLNENREYHILEFECGDLQEIDVEFEFIEKIPADDEGVLISRFMLDDQYTDTESDIYMDDRNIFEKINGEYVSLSEYTYLDDSFDPSIYFSSHTKAVVKANTKYAFVALLWTGESVWYQIKVYMERGTPNERSEYIQLRSYFL